MCVHDAEHDFKNSVFKVIVYVTYEFRFFLVLWSGIGWSVVGAFSRWSVGRWSVGSWSLVGGLLVGGFKETRCHFMKKNE